jgi:hypothetical protein
MGRHRRAGVLVGALAVLMIVVPAASGISAASKATAVPAKLVGTWTRKVTSADVKREHPTDPTGDSKIAAGQVWRLTIKKSGPATLSGPYYWVGPITPAGANRVHISVYVAYPNVYRWRVSGRLLTLTKISDYLPTRAAVLQGIWKRK